MRYFFEGCALDTSLRELRRGDVAVPVEPQVFDLLAYLIRHRDRVVSQDDLLAEVWDGRVVSESTLRSRLNAARRAIGDTGDEQRLIRTFPRRGFRFVGEVREETGDVQTAPTVPAALEDRVVVPISLAPAAVSLREVSPSLRPAGKLIGAMLAGAALAAIATSAAFLLWPSGQKSVSPAAPGNFDSAIIPLIADETRRSLASYPARRDAKALAISSNGIGIAEGAPNMESARQEALQQCASRAKRPCRIYADGLNVVWPPDALSLPGERDLRKVPLQALLVADELPTLRLETRQEIGNRYMTSPNHKALALTTAGSWFVRERTTRAEAIRLAVEGCADRWQRPCLIISVDGYLTTEIPKSRKVLRIFLPSTEGEIEAAERERIGQAYQGADWRAVARGKNAWHATAAAKDENAAVEAVLQDCARSDSGCRLYAIGNFRVADE